LLNVTLVDASRNQKVNGQRFGLFLLQGQMACEGNRTESRMQEIPCTIICMFLRTVHHTLIQNVREIQAHYNLACSKTFLGCCCTENLFSCRRSSHSFPMFHVHSGRVTGYVMQLCCAAVRRQTRITASAVFECRLFVYIHY
jgi:hypothetical protein